VCGCTHALTNYHGCYAAAQWQQQHGDNTNDDDNRSDVAGRQQCGRTITAVTWQDNGGGDMAG